jgi:hypothetical protein
VRRAGLPAELDCGLRDVDNTAKGFSAVIRTSIPRTADTLTLGVLTSPFSSRGSIGCRSHSTGTGSRSTDAIVTVFADEFIAAASTAPFNPAFEASNHGAACSPVIGER